MDRIIRVTGRGKISVKPDTIRLGIDSSKLCKEYGDAVKQSAEDTGLLRETIKNAGLDPAELKTVRFDIDAVYESYRDKNNNYKNKHVGYKYRHILYINFPNDNEQLGKAYLF